MKGSDELLKKQLLEEQNAQININDQKDLQDQNQSAFEEQQKIKELEEYYGLNEENLSENGEIIEDQQIEINQIKLDKGRKRVKREMPPQYENGVMTAPKKQENIIDKLLNNERTFHHDSGKMTDVKDGIRAVERAIEEAGEGVLTVAEIESILGKYDTAIKACDIYIKDPKKSKTSERHMLVKANMKRMEGEYEKLQRAKDLVADGTWANKTASVFGLIDEVSKLSANEQISNDALIKKDQAEFKALKKQQPFFTEEDYKWYKKFNEVMAFQTNKQYMTEYAKGEDVWKKAGAHGTFTRDATLIFKPVMFDGRGVPVNEEYKANHEWNLKWLKAWEEDDVETRENMIEERLPRIFDKVILPDLTEDDLKDEADISEKLDKWVEQLREDPDFPAMMLAFKAGVTLDQTMKAHPAIKEFVNNNPAYAALGDLCDVLTFYFDAYNTKNHLFASGTDVVLQTKGEVDKSEEDAHQKIINNGMVKQIGSIAMIKERFKKYLEVKDTVEIPYQKPEITDEMRQKKINRPIELSRQAEMNRKLAMIEKDPEYLRLSKETAAVTPEKFMAVIDARPYEKMLGHKPYKDLIKNSKNKKLRTLTGPVRALLTTVHFKENGEVTEEDIQKDEANKRWLTAIGSGNLGEIQNMMKDQVRQLLNAFPIQNYIGSAANELARTFAREPEQTVEKLNQIRGVFELIKAYPAAGELVDAEAKTKLEVLDLQLQYAVVDARKQYDLDLSGIHATYAKSLTREERTANEKQREAIEHEYDKTYRRMYTEDRLRDEKAAWTGEGKTLESWEQELKNRKQAADTFNASFDSLGNYLKKNELKLNIADIRRFEQDRKKRQKAGGLKILSDHEAYEMLGKLDMNDPMYAQNMTEMVTVLKDHYDISVDAMTKIETFRRMYTSKKDHEYELGVKAQRKERIAKSRKKPFKANIKPLKHVVQEKGQTYGNSCWAASGANLINAMQRKLSEENNELSFEKVDDNFFLQKRNLEYNEAGKNKANAMLGNMSDTGMVDDYTAIKKEIEGFRNNPNSKAGQLLPMADFLLEATDNRAMVRSAQFDLTTDQARECEDLLKDEFLKTVAEALNKNNGDPISILNGGHYLTIVGMKGRNLICKNSLNRSEPDKDEPVSVDEVFEKNKAKTAGKGGVVEIVWMEPITDQTMEDVKQEFPEVATDYERLRKEGKDMILPQEYSHVHGIDFEKEIKRDADPVLEGLIKKRVYLPKGKPGEKVLSQKKMVCNTITEQTNAVKDAKIQLRRSIDINYKKKLDFATFEKLSEFGLLIGDKQKLSELMLLYGEGRKQTEEEKKEKNKTFEALDVLTEQIKKIDEQQFDMSSDTTMMAKAKELESMSGAVSAYRKLLEANPDYVKYLWNKKTEGNPDNDANMMMFKLDKLIAISDYYRIRKLVVTDEYYVTIQNDYISSLDARGDDLQIKRLKKMMRASDQAALSMYRILGMPIPEGLEKKVTDIRTNKSKGMEKDMLGVLDKVKYEVTDNKFFTPEKQFEMRMDTLSSANSYIQELERERFFQAPLWMRNALTLDPVKMASNKNEEISWAAGSINADTQMCVRELNKDKRAVALNEKRRELLKKKTGEPNIGDPKFLGGKDKELETLSLSDNWNRIQNAFSMDYAYLRSDEEILEITELMSIQKHKDWDKIAKDEEAKDFYESAYKQMGMKLLFSNYAAVKRLSETVGMKIALLHPTDLALQMTPQLRTAILNSCVLSNALDGNPGIPNIFKSSKMTKKIEEFFKENDKEGIYNMDVNDANIHLDFIGSANLKIAALGQGICDEILSSEEKAEQLFGDRLFYNNKVLPYVEEYRKKYKIEGDYIDGFDVTSNKTAIAFYMTKHPELFTKEIMNKKFSKKKGYNAVLQETMVDGFNRYMDSNEVSMKTALEKKLVNIPTKEEIERYEQHLKDEDYPAIRLNYDFNADEELDPEGELEFNVLEEGKLVNKKISNAQVIKEREADPYGIKLIAGGFKELEYEDPETKKKYMRTGLENY